MTKQQRKYEEISNELCPSSSFFHSSCVTTAGILQNFKTNKSLYKRGGKVSMLSPFTQDQTLIQPTISRFFNFF